MAPNKHHNFSNTWIKKPGLLEKGLQVRVDGPGPQHSQLCVPDPFPQGLQSPVELHRVSPLRDRPSWHPRGQIDVGAGFHMEGPWVRTVRIVVFVYLEVQQREQDEQEALQEREGWQCCTRQRVFAQSCTVCFL